MNVCDNSRKRRYFHIVFLMTGLLLASRFVCLTHNMALHPDEHVFYKAAESLLNRLIGVSPDYIEVKAYPEGAILMQLPFQALGALLKGFGFKKFTARVCGRAAAAVYFAAGGILGSVILVRYMNEKKTAQIIYGLILLFSPLHLEQSRYGTGEAPSFFLLMLMLYLCAESMHAGPKKRSAYLVSAFFTAGVLGAVKYPQLFFTLVPQITLFGIRKTCKPGQFSFMLALSCCVLLGGFLLFSPGVLINPHYLQRVTQREMNAYLYGGNVAEMGGPLNHMLSLLLYMLLYAGFPGMLIFLLPRETALPAAERDTDVLFKRTVPIVLGIFFLYNLFVTTLFMRTYYPFFCAADLYAASAAADWTQGKRARKTAIGILTVLMVLRGGYNIFALTETNALESLTEMITPFLNCEDTEPLLLGPGNYVPGLTKQLENPTRAEIDNEEMFPDLASLNMKKGQLVITGTLDHSRCNHYLLPVHNANVENRIARWDAFQQMNQDAYVGQIYPEYYYYLFGYWLKGTTGTDYEFPTNAVYYCRHDSPWENG